MTRVLDQLALGQFEPLGLALPGFLQWPMRLIDGLRAVRRASTYAAGLCSCGLFLLAL